MHPVSLAHQSLLKMQQMINIKFTKNMCQGKAMVEISQSDTDAKNLQAL